MQEENSHIFVCHIRKSSEALKKWQDVAGQAPAKLVNPEQFSMRPREVDHLGLTNKRPGPEALALKTSLVETRCDYVGHIQQHNYP